MNGQKTAGRRVPVLIVGGGITGLSASLFLLQQGIRPLLVEKHCSTSIHPRARGFDVRTMELFRELKLDSAIREAGKALSGAWGIHTGSTLFTVLKDLPRREGPAPEHPLQLPGMEELAALSPVSGARCTQDLAEPVLLAAALDRGGELLFGMEMVRFCQDHNGVDVLLRHRQTGAEEDIRADYMIAADGAGSPVRHALGAVTSGSGPLSQLLNIYFEADLGDFVRGREFSMLRCDEPGRTGLLTSINNSNRWVFHLYYDPAAGESPADFPEERILGILQQLIGLPGLPIRILSVLPWQPTVTVADAMQHGRIFLAGDAAHVMTPYGGKGAATGIQDVHNLAWKLAAVLRGQADSALLQTYSAERQPVGLANALQSGRLAGPRGLPAAEAFPGKSFWNSGQKTPEQLKTLLKKLAGIERYAYCSAAILDEEKQEDNSDTGILRPGERAPHVWVEYFGERISILDVFGKDFVLLSSDIDAWKPAVAQQKTRNNLPIRAYDIGPGKTLNDPADQWRCQTGMEAGEALLVRPDGFIAWKGPDLGDHAAQLSAALEQIARAAPAA
ncbi:FAD-dependent oxidoreductase [Compostibacter hankyongensis]